MPGIRSWIIAKLVASCSLAVLVSHQALAVGFIVNPTSEVTGVANAGTAVYDRSVAAVHNNPAAMALMPDSSAPLRIGEWLG